MRKVITLKVEKPKLSEAEIKDRIAKIIKLFDTYLDEYPVKSAKSKHAVMGPVAKVLDRAEAGQWDVEPLTGYALRMHEMNPRVRGFISQIAVESLHTGTQELIELCKNVPETELATTIEQIDYGLYFQRRLKGTVWLEAQSKALITYLRGKYTDDASFRKAWGLSNKDKITMHSIRFFGPNNKRYSDGNATLKADMDTFYDQMHEPEAIEEEDN